MLCAIASSPANRSLREGRGERPAGRAELLAKKGASGRTQRPPELGTDPWMRREGSGKLRKVAALWKNPELLRQSLANVIQENSGTVWIFFGRK